MQVDKDDVCVYIGLMLRTQIYLPEDLMADLRYLAAVENVSVSEAIRKNLRKSLRQASQKLGLMEGFVGKGKAGRKIDGVKEITFYYQNFGNEDSS